MYMELLTLYTFEHIRRYTLRSFSTMDAWKWVLLGHLCGDAAGATLEFFKGGDIDDDIARHAMHMPGGGALNVARGQITDDGELTLALYHTLCNASAHMFPLDDIAVAYINWYNTFPFDVGYTCRRAFGMMATHANERYISLKMLHNSLKVNIASKSNGALMRAAPIAMWGVSNKHTLDQIATYARLDAMLSHPNMTCQDTNALYCVSIASYLYGSPTPMGDVDTYIRNNGCSSEVFEWYTVSKSLDSLAGVNCKEMIGFVKHAFILAMYFAHKGKSIPYENGILEVLKCGGDTDTNAAICGAMLGAIHGADIPIYMYEPVLDFNCEMHDSSKTLNGYRRPPEYNTSKLKSLFNETQ